MPLEKIAYFVSLVFIPYVVGAAEAPVANRWDAKARQAGITPLQRRAYQQLAKLHDFKAQQLTNWGHLYYVHPRPNPMTILRDMGMDVLPALAEALDDDTPTKTVIVDTSGGSPRGHEPYVVKVNELVARLVRDITEYQFTVGDIELRQIEAHRDLIPEFRKRILEWYKKNKDKTLEERKIENLNGDLQVRVMAESWLGQSRSVKAFPYLVTRIGAILGGREDSGTQSELAEVALALGRIGDPKGLPAVQKACDHLSDVLPRSPASGAIQELFTAYQGLALLGHKKEALVELKRIYKEYGAKMEAHRRTEFEVRLAEAAKW